MHRPAIFLILACTLLAALAPADGQVANDSLDARAIYDRTRAVVAARTVPAFIAYTQDTQLVRHGKIKAERARIILRTADGKANVTALPAGPGDRVDARPVVKDHPLVYPMTSFGLVKRRAGEAASEFAHGSPAAAQADVSGPTVIGRVASTSRDYDATLAGTETLDGARVYHLRLVPRSDPEHHRIRDLYVDATTFDPRRIAIEVWAAAGPVHSRPTVNVDFAPIDGTWMIVHASMDFVLRLAFFSAGGSGEFRTSDVSFPAAEPDWLFDSAALEAHLKTAPPQLQH